jgi:hypothetical protein
MIALANTNLIFQFMETDMVNSAVTTLSIFPDAAETLMILAMHTYAAQAWIENMKHYPHIHFDILHQFGTGVAMLAGWATDPQRNNNLQNGVEQLETDKILHNIERHFEDIVHNINKAVDDTSAGNFGTNPTPLWESVCPTDAQNYKAKERMRLGINDHPTGLRDQQINHGNGNNNNRFKDRKPNPGNKNTREKQMIARKTNPASSNESTQKNLLDSKTYLNGTDLTTTRKPKFAANSAKEKVKAVALDPDASTLISRTKQQQSSKNPSGKH